MTKQNHEDRERHIKHIERQNTLLNFFLYDIARYLGGEFAFGPADAHENDQQTGFTLTLYRAKDAHGGYVLIKQINGPTAPSLVYLDDIDRRWPTPIPILADRLRVARQRIFDAEAQANRLL